MVIEKDDSFTYKFNEELKRKSWWLTQWYKNGRKSLQKISMNRDSSYMPSLHICFVLKLA